MEIKQDTSKKYKTRDVLLVASYLTKQEGYQPVSAGDNSTKEKVTQYLDTHTSVEDLVSCYQNRAEQAIKWLKEEKTSEWIENVKSCLSKKEVEDRMVGVVASMFSGFDSSMKRNAAKEELKKSEYQGKPKQSISFQMKSFKHLTKLKSKFDEKKFVHLMQIIDFNGNVYIWFADSDYSKDLETCRTIHAIVKRHNEREGVKQTVIDVREIE